jgi:hypothetical protein
MPATGSARESCRSPEPLWYRAGPPATAATLTLGCDVEELHTPPRALGLRHRLVPASIQRLFPRCAFKVSLFSAPGEGTLFNRPRFLPVVANDIELLDPSMNLGTPSQRGR